METRVAREERRRPRLSVSYDASQVRVGQVLRVNTHNSAYYFVFNEERRINRDEIVGVSVTTTNKAIAAGNPNSVRVDRTIRQGESLRFGTGRGTTTSPVVSVFVGDTQVV